MTHRFALGKMTPQKNYKGGSRADARVSNFSVLKGMSLSLLILQPRGVREPHWHPNANELSYCLEGTGLMTIFSPREGHDTFTIGPGQIAFVPMGALHHIENTGNSPLRMLVCFDHEAAEDLEISSGVAVMPNHIMAETFQVDDAFFKGLKKEIKPTFISQRESVVHPLISQETDRFKLDVEANSPQISAPGGWVKLSNNFLLPTLEGLSLYSVLLKKSGAREPHWHPNAAELNYLTRGTARITLLSPGGQVDTFDMKPGDISFLPRGYLHYIENTGNDDAHFAIFFNHIAPSDIGISGCLGAYSNEILASLFGVSASYFDKLPKYQHDLRIVKGPG